MAFQPSSGSGEEKTFKDVIKGFDSDRHRVMLAVPMKTTLLAVSGSLPTSLLLTFIPSLLLFPLF